MSKEIYIVNCYTCQHNGQETCKGCNTLLNGDVEPYENWELREDLSQKDQRIAELEQDLEFTTKTANELIEIKHKLEQELAELKEKAIVPKFKIGQEVFIVDKNYFKIEHYKIANCKILGIEDKLDRKNNYVRWYTLKIYNSSYLEYRRYKFKEKDVFATEQEAQDKLKEIQGNE